MTTKKKKVGLAELLVKQNEYLLIQMDEKIVERLSETNGIIYRLEDKLTQRIDDLEAKTKAGFEKMQERFDKVDREILAGDASSEDFTISKVEKLRAALEPRLEKLEKHVFAI